VTYVSRQNQLLFFFFDLFCFVFRQRRKNAVLERGKRQDKDIFIKEEQKKRFSALWYLLARREYDTKARRLV
jgi:hypothetical protein